MQEPSPQVSMPSFRRVDSGHGVQWWSSSWQLLFNRGAALIWIVMCFVAAVIYVLLHLVPLLGWIAAHIALFMFTGGLMLAARKTDQGAPPAFGDLFAGFGPPLGSLVIAATLLTIVVLVVVGGLAVAGAGAAFGAAYGGMTGNIGLLAGLGATSVLLLLAVLVLLVPVGMAAWLAPAMIVLRQQPPVEALRESLAACWANAGALAVYGLLWIAFAILVTIAGLLGWLVLMPLMALSAYAAYRDLFESAAPLAPSA
ncbi:MAG TPA: BPSS1780 family membrane protein [Burkholderiaceae bacterium]|jgi:hypothetical protein|nr:BPSS1780 family membrane protein [Burkholderiaceae bacterium]